MRKAKDWITTKASLVKGFMHILHGTLQIKTAVYSSAQSLPDSLKPGMSRVSMAFLHRFFALKVYSYPF